MKHRWSGFDCRATDPLRLACECPGGSLQQVVTSLMVRAEGTWGDPGPVRGWNGPDPRRTPAGLGSEGASLHLSRLVDGIMVGLAMTWLRFNLPAMHEGGPGDGLAILCRQYLVGTWHPMGDGFARSPRSCLLDDSG